MLKTFLRKIIRLMPLEFTEIIRNEKTKNYDYQIVEYWRDKSKTHLDRSVPSIPSDQDVKNYEFAIKKQKPKRTLILGATPELRDLSAKYSQESVIADITFEAIIGFLQYTKNVDPLKEIWLRANWLNLPLPDKYFDCIMGDLVLNQLDARDHRHFLTEMKRLLKENGQIIIRCTFSNPKYENEDSQLIIKNTLKEFRNKPRLGLELLAWRLQSRFVDSDKKMNLDAIKNSLQEYLVAHDGYSNPDIRYLIKNNSNMMSWTQLTKKELFFVLKSFFIINEINISEDYEDSDMFPIVILKNREQDLNNSEIKKTANLEIIKRNFSDNKEISTKVFPFKPMSENVKTNNNYGVFCSIVIPTYNRSKTLILTLNSVANQTIPSNQYEILIIDDGSTDNTKEVVLDFQKRHPNRNIRYFYQQNGGPAKARNLGIRESRGEIIFFTDDDCIVPQNWMETLLDGYKRYPDVVGVGGWLMEPKETLKKSYLARYVHYIQFYIDYFPARTLFNCEILSNDPERGLGNFAGNTANLSIKREVLEQMNGFREDYYWPGSEDSDLSFRILNAGLKLLYVPFHVEHIKNIDLRGLLKLFFKRGANFYLFLKFNQKALEKINADNPANYDTFPILIKRLFYRPQKFLTLLQFVSHKAGMTYMKNKLEE